MSTYVLIEKYTVGAGGASSVTLGSGGTIPQTFTDLKLVMSSRGNNSSASEWVSIKFNGSSANYSSRWLEGNGSGTPGSFTGPTNRGYAGVQVAATATASTFSNMEIYIPNYTVAQSKSYSADTVQENNATAATAELGAGLWANNTAISSIAITPDNSSLFVQYSTFYLYGILKA